MGCSTENPTPDLNPNKKHEQRLRAEKNKLLILTIDALTWDIYRYGAPTSITLEDEEPTLIYNVHACICASKKVDVFLRYVYGHRGLRISKKHCRWWFGGFRSKKDKEDESRDVGYWLDMSPRLNAALAMRLEAMAWVSRQKLDLERRRSRMQQAMKAVRENVPNYAIKFVGPETHWKGCLSRYISTDLAGCTVSKEEKEFNRPRVESYFTGDYLAALFLKGALDDEFKMFSMNRAEIGQWVKTKRT